MTTEKKKIIRRRIVLYSILIIAGISSYWIGQNWEYVWGWFAGGLWMFVNQHYARNDEREELRKDIHEIQDTINSFK